MTRHRGSADNSRFELDMISPSEPPVRDDRRQDLRDHAAHRCADDMRPLIPRWSSRPLDIVAMSTRV